MDIETVGKVYQPKGHALVFHPDLIHGTPLGSNINEYQFFSYNANEALLLASSSSTPQSDKLVFCFVLIGG